MTTAAAGSRDLRRVTLVVGITNTALYAALTAGAWAAWGGLQAELARERSLAAVVADGVLILVINLAFGFAVLAGALALGVLDRGWPARVGVTAAVSAAASVPRMAALVSLGSTPTGVAYVTATGGMGFLSGLVGVLAAVFAGTLVDRARREEQRRAAEADRARRAVDALQDEELRVRRMVFDQLHGTLQYHLVSVTAGLDRLAEDLDAAGAGDRGTEVRAWAETLEEIREQDVRSLSHAVFPSGADLGTEEAIALLLHRLPAQVSTSIEIGPVYRGLVDRGAAPMPMAERLVVIYTVEEAVTNALKHGRAHTVQVRAEAEPTADPEHWVFATVVDDDGTGPTRPDPPLHGLARHRERLEHRGGTLTLGTNPDGGGRLSFRLPFTVAPGAPPS
ncbi:sensor histidine kinase [Cellulomonas sp. Y8]|uniref:sensor histidine kinase n=1 Tax=Cellulomonas sp. Y8 TaxID=2591145 RepID=UPI003D71CEA7